MIVWAMFRLELQPSDRNLVISTLKEESYGESKRQ